MTGKDQERTLKENEFTKTNSNCTREGGGKFNRQKFSQFQTERSGTKFYKMKSPKIFFEPCRCRDNNRMGGNPKMAPGFVGDTPIEQ
jgi:hypothetical protein